MSLDSIRNISLIICSILLLVVGIGLPGLLMNAEVRDNEGGTNYLTVGSRATTERLAFYSTCVNFPVPREYYCPVAANGAIYFFGGYFSSNQTYTDEVWKYEPDNGTFEKLNWTCPKYQNAGISDGTYIYLFPRNVASGYSMPIYRYCLANGSKEEWGSFPGYSGVKTVLPIDGKYYLFPDYKYSGAALHLYYPENGTREAVSVSLGLSINYCQAVTDGETIYFFHYDSSGDYLTTYNPGTGNITKVTITFPEYWNAFTPAWNGTHVLIVNTDESPRILYSYKPETNTLKETTARADFWFDDVVQCNGTFYYFAGGKDFYRLGLDPDYDRFNAYQNYELATLDTKLPAATWGLAAASTGTKTYLFGGTVYDTSVSGYTQMLDQILVFDPTTQTVSAVQARLSTEMTGARAVWDTDRSVFYIIGGGTQQILKYNPATDTCLPSAVTLEYAAVKFGAAYSNGYVYMFMGGWGGHNTADVFRYDPDTDQLTKLSVTSPLGGQGVIAATNPTTGDIYLFKGKDIERFDPKTETFTSVPMDLTGGSFQAALFYYDHFILVGGGSMYTYNKLEIFSPYRTETIPIIQLTEDTEQFGASVDANGQTYIFGGTDGSNEFYDTIVAFRPRDSTGPTNGNTTPPLAFSVEIMDQSTVTRVNEEKSTELTFVVKAGEALVPDADILISVNKGALSNTSGKTDGQGTFRTTYTAPVLDRTSSEPMTLTVKVEKFGNYLKYENTFTITVYPKSQPVNPTDGGTTDEAWGDVLPKVAGTVGMDPITFIIVIIAVIIVVIVLAVLIRIAKVKKHEKEDAEKVAAKKPVIALDASYERGTVLLVNFTITNESNHGYAEVTVTPKLSTNKFEVLTDKLVIPNIKKEKSETVTLELKPKTQCSEEPVSGEISYFDMHKKTTLSLPPETVAPVKVTIHYPSLLGKTVARDEWEEAQPASMLSKGLKNITLDIKDVFTSLSNQLDDINLRKVDERIDEHRSVGRFYAEDRDGNKYTTMLEIVGSKYGADLDIKCGVNPVDPQRLLGFYFKIENDILKRTKALEKHIKKATKAATKIQREEEEIEEDRLKQLTEHDRMTLIKQLETMKVLNDAELKKLQAEYNIELKELQMIWEKQHRMRSDRELRDRLEQKLGTETIDQYIVMLENFYEDGILDEDERGYLKEKQQAMGVTSEEHQLLLEVALKGRLVCPNADCGRLIEASWSLCPSCGTKVK